jgi:flagellar biosynthesis/type III secretory pathway protein FliH
MASPEAPQNHEQIKTPEARDRAQELGKKLEAVKETSAEQQAEQIEKARHEAKEFFAREAGKESKQGGEPSGFRAVRQATKDAKDAAYAQTMRLIRTELPGPSRVFSKVIHAPVVERSSEVIGGTLARPNAILAGSATALILVICVYILARTFGYHLSGFETIGAFLLGWVLGLIYDYVRVMTLGRR